MSTLLLRTLRGRDSRLLPQSEDGARARTEAFVSKELRRRRFEEDARVIIEASSLRTPFAVAATKLFGFGAKWLGTADAGGEIGY
jgi:hypothetical protein